LWHAIITLDEEWFDLHKDYELIWLQPGDLVPERERHMIQYEKVMLTIIWNPTGFHVIDFLSRRAKFKDNHSGTNVLSPLALLFGLKLKSGRPIEN
jgi:hypothetical protein